MWKWIKGKFYKNEKGFTGFKVELYRDGKLIMLQRGNPDQILSFSPMGGPIIFDGVRLYGYSLTPHLDSNISFAMKISK